MLIEIKDIVNDGQLDGLNKESHPLLVPRVEPPIIKPPPRIIEPDPVAPIVPVDPIVLVDPILSGDPLDLSGPGDVSTVGDNSPIASPDGTIDQKTLYERYQIPDEEHGGSPTPYDGLSPIPEYQAAAYPTPAPIFNDIFKNTMDYIETLPNFKTLMGPDRSLFYSGFNPNARPDDKYRSYYFEARELAAGTSKTCWDGVFLEFKTRTDDELRNLGFTVKELQLDLKIASAAFARLSSGDVRVIIPDEGVRRRNTWTDFEWPELLTNGKVTRIIRVRPDTLEEKVIWAADRDLPYFDFEINRPVDTLPSY